MDIESGMVNWSYVQNEILNCFHGWAIKMAGIQESAYIMSYEVIQKWLKPPASVKHYI